MKMFHKKADENIVQYNTNQYEQEIPEKLHASVKNGSWKDNVPHQHKTGWKTDEKRYNKGCDMGFERDETQVQNLFM
jgi:hypothetical protein